MPEDAVPWIYLNSNEKNCDHIRAREENWKYIRSFFERLTEWLVLEAAQAVAIEETGLYIWKSGKHLYLKLSGESECELFCFSFYLRRNGWTWQVRQGVDGVGLVTIESVRRPLTENPIEALPAIVKGIGLSLL
ncbi:MAG: hypothetical protein RQ862_03585 [Candidatus Caldarchaeales archaeon]|nr:hypothetical protein [Candidatus Caldarchaeales archaeon]